MIHFDNGIQHKCASNTFVVKVANASLPPNESPSLDWHDTSAAANEEGPDSQEAEHMPGVAYSPDGDISQQCGSHCTGLPVLNKNNPLLCFFIVSQSRADF